MQSLNDVSVTPLIIVLRVHREQQESLAHADREDQRLVLLSRLVLIYRWRAWHLSENGGSTWAMFEGNPHRFSLEASYIHVTNTSWDPFCDLNHFVFFSRGLEERGDQEDQQEKLDQRCVKYFTTTFSHILWYKFTIYSLFCLIRVTQEMTAHQDLPVRGYVPSHCHQGSLYSHNIYWFT